MPPPLSCPRGRRSASRGRTDGNIVAVSHGQHVSIANRCSCLTRQHGGEQCGLVTLTFGLLTLKLVSESRVTWTTSMPILVFLRLFVLDLGPMYATDRQTDVRQTDRQTDRETDRQTSDALHRLMLPPITGGGITISYSNSSIASVKLLFRHPL